MSVATLRFAPAGSYGGHRLVMRRPQPTLSAKAQALGLETLEDVDEEFDAQRQGWSRGTEYHCPACGANYRSVSGAKKHMKHYGHKVLRWDWY